MERAAAVELYEKLVATNPNVERKGATIPYTSHQGHMFSMLTKSNQVALRLPATARAAFLKTYKTELCEQYGIVQTEYVMVPDALLAKTRELKRHFDASLAYVAAMKPKPTTRTKRPKTPARRTRATS
jgi:hypothetical protein